MSAKPTEGLGVLRRQNPIRAEISGSAKGVGKSWNERLLFASDLGGTAVFAMGGALTAIQAGLDLLGVLVLSFCTALGGGVVRDLLIGDVPPIAIRDFRYPVVAFAVGALTFLLHGPIEMIPFPFVITFDAAGLSLFAVSGAGKALARRIHPFVATLMGAITGAGGGVIRDMLLARVPLVLHVDIYATAALAGAAVLVVMRALSVPTDWATAVGGLACFALRLVAVWQGWGLPRVEGF
ncbi:trimeric intracellular cation channel family protein [Pseudonocardia yunnanensis]|uniref:Trimeric intracellular cation channel family protein n=1 Tax=Pseudonocardia yunnanensis TaxID=58107 RepID=A0ABW4F9X5_9PSEU